MSRAIQRNPRVGPVLTPAGAGDDHRVMKSLLSVLALSATLGLVAGCGPQDAFCPNTSDAGGVCPINGDDAIITPMDMKGGGLCGSGQYLGDNPDGNMDKQVCLCSSNNALPPCP
jgi:hypothetical protein